MYSNFKTKWQISCLFTCHCACVGSKGPEVKSLRGYEVKHSRNSFEESTKGCKIFFTESIDTHTIQEGQRCPKRRVVQEILTNRQNGQKMDKRTVRSTPISKAT